MIEDLVKNVYEKMCGEYNKFIEELKKENNEEIIKNSYKITIMKEILIIFPWNENYSKYQLEALLNIDKPLEFLYDEWLDCDRNINEVLNDNLIDSLYILEDNYISKRNMEIKNDSNFGLIKDISDTLKNLDSNKFCNTIKKKFNLEEFELMDVYEIISKPNGINYLYNFYTELKNNNDIYFKDLPMISNEIYNDIDKKILPKLRELLNEKNKNYKDKEER